MILSSSGTAILSSVNKKQIDFQSYFLFRIKANVHKLAAIVFSFVCFNKNQLINHDMQITTVYKTFEN